MEWTQSRWDSVTRTESQQKDKKERWPSLWSKRISKFNGQRTVCSRNDFRSLTSRGQILVQTAVEVFIPKDWKFKVETTERK